ncbi:unnamed protein product [Rotaria magnacalcarata]|uniref:Uncharacterized protein n=1 Tax=Rotaria magnacalcarata TaxID=392030 RepID=A0A815PV58_9BILA|nr:unnamed protein product [Rotaria magnacalcarata]
MAQPNGLIFLPAIEVYTHSISYERGSVEDASRSIRPTTVRTVENIQLVSQTILPNPYVSQRRAALELNISRAGLRRLMKDLNLKPYKPRLLQALNEDDPDRRLEFCE